MSNDPSSKEEDAVKEREHIKDTITPLFRVKREHRATTNGEPQIKKRTDGRHKCLFKTCKGIEKTNYNRMPK